MQFHGEVSIVIYNKVKSCFRNTQISSRESLLKPAHGFAVTMITILLVVCAAYEKTAEAARSEFYSFQNTSIRQQRTSQMIRCSPAAFESKIVFGAISRMPNSARSPAMMVVRDWS